jgi:hypothetical protein
MFSSTDNLLATSYTNATKKIISRYTAAFFVAAQQVKSFLGSENAETKGDLFSQLFLQLCYFFK